MGREVISGDELRARLSDLLKRAGLPMEDFSKTIEHSSIADLCLTVLNVCEALMARIEALEKAKS